MGDDRVTVDDLIRAGYCPSGIRRWCTDKGVSLRHVLHDGLTFDEVREINDGLLNRALELKLAVAKTSENKG